MSENNETATKRIAVRPSIFQEVRDFSNGMEGNYSDVLEFVFRSLQHPGETPFEAGRRLSAEFKRTHSAVAARNDKE